MPYWQVVCGCIEGRSLAPPHGVWFMSVRWFRRRADAWSTQVRCAVLHHRVLGCEPLEARVLLAADLTPPQATLTVPVDNSSDDLDSRTALVHIDTTTPPPEFALALTDEESGVDSESVQADRFALFQNGREMASGDEYVFSFDANAGTATFAASSPFVLDARYRIVVDNSPLTGVRDGAGNPLAANQTDGTTQFAILLTDTVNDPPQLLVPSAVAVQEDRRLVFSVAAGNGLSVADPDAFLGDNRFEMRINVEHGQLTLATRDGLQFAVGDGEDDVSMTFLGDAAAVDAALDGLEFAPDANYAGPATIELQSSDLGNFTGSSNTAATDSATIAVTVSAVNDAPVHVVPVSLETSEDLAITLAAETGHQIEVSDVDVGEGELEITLTAENGRITLDSEADVVFHTGGRVDQSAVVFSGSSAAVNEMLSSVTFTPTMDFNDSIGAARIVIISRDRGNTGAGGEQIVADEISISVQAVNDPPVNSAPQTLTLDEDGAYALVAAEGTAISISDVDSNEGTGEVRVSLTALHGVLTTTEQEGLQFETGDGIADRQMVLQGQLVDVNAALDGMVFQADLDYAGPATIDVITTDVGAVGDVASDRDLVQLLVRAVNDAPRVEAPGLQHTDEDMPLALTAGNENAIWIVDVDAAEGVLALDLSATGGVIDLGVVDGLVFQLGDGNHDAQVVVSGTLQDLNGALAELVFTPDSDRTGEASLTLSVDDGGNSGEGGALSGLNSIDIVIQPVNDPPTAFNDGAIAHRETSVVIDVVANDTDVDGSIVESSVQVVRDPEHGTVIVQADGSVSYLPEIGFSGVDSFRYTVRDDQGLESNQALVAVIVNHPPVAVDDARVTDQNSAVEIDVLANDTDPDGQLVAASVAIVTPPAHGAATVAANGLVTYVPQLDYVGFDHFVYTVEDNLGATSNAAAVTIGVEWVAPFQNPNQPYDVNDDGSVTAIDVLLIINLINLNADFPGALPTPSVTPFVPPAYYDVNGDNHVTAADAIEVTNFVNSQDQNPEGEADRDNRSLSGDSGIALLVGLVDETRRRQLADQCAVGPLGGSPASEQWLAAGNRAELGPSRGGVTESAVHIVQVLAVSRPLDGPSLFADQHWLETLRLEFLAHTDLHLQMIADLACATGP